WSGPLSRWLLSRLHGPAVKLSAQVACRLQAVDADIQIALVPAADPKPAVFPSRFALRPEWPAVNVGGVFQRMNAPVAFLRHVLAPGAHRRRSLNLRHASLMTAYDVPGRKGRHTACASIRALLTDA